MFLLAFVQVDYTDSMLVQIRIEGTLATFNQTDFENEVSLWLKLDKSQFSIISLREGSVIVQMKIYGALNRSNIIQNNLIVNI